MTAGDWSGRLDSVERRLDACAAVAAHGLTSADPATGERWEAGQVWAHLVELVPYWIAQAEMVLAAPEAGAPFGRTKTDAGRVGAIERDRHRAVGEMNGALGGEIAALRAFIAGLTATDLQRQGTHPTRGRMTVEALLEEFLVGHLEEHADQLEQLERAV